MKIIDSEKKYLLQWRNNPFYWNYKLKDIKAKYKKGENVVKRNGVYYTEVKPLDSVSFYMVDCICDFNTGDTFPIDTSLLKEL